MDPKFQNPAATADIIVEQNNKILLIRRLKEPYKGKWALPGGHLDYGQETLEHTAARELKEETNLTTKETDLRLLGIYSEPNRDPRGHYITHVYLTKNIKGVVKADDDADIAKWFDLDNLPSLAFDHNRIIKDYKAWEKIEHVT